MTQTDPIADFITIIRNAMLARKLEVVADHSRMREDIARILGREGFVERYEVYSEGRGRSPRFRKIRVHLRYYDDLRRFGPLNYIKRVSKPSRRVYVDSGKNLPLRGGTGVRILSTSSGVLSDADARRMRVGGEVLMEVW